MAPPPEYSPPAAGRCGEQRPQGALLAPCHFRNYTGNVAKGAAGWTLGQGKGRNRGQGCRGMDPWAGKGPESWPRVSRDGPLGRERAGIVAFEAIRCAQGDRFRVTGSGEVGPIRNRFVHCLEKMLSLH